MSPRLRLLLDSGAVSRVPALLGPRDQVNRLLFWTNELEHWSRGICDQPNTNAILNVNEQLNLMFSDFLAGKPLSSGLARCDPPRGQGIWRLKTPDLRLYGWADCPQCMVLAAGELKSVLAKPGPPKDRDLGERTVDARSALKLSCVYGERYDIFPTTS